MVGFVGQIQFGEQLVDPGIVLGQTEITGLQTQNLAHRKERVEHQFLRYHPQGTARGAIIVARIVTQNTDSAGILAAQTSHAGNQRGFTGTVGAQ